MGIIGETTNGRPGVWGTFLSLATRRANLLKDFWALELCGV